VQLVNRSSRIGSEVFVRPVSMAVIARESVRHDVLETLKAAGLRPTRQRVALMRLLYGQGNRHVTAEMLYEEAIGAEVNVTVATVYNTLNQLIDADLLGRVSIDGTKTYFDTNVSAHHHFYIEGTRELIDIPIIQTSVQDIQTVPDGYEIRRIDTIVRLRTSA
jgi:Fur family iron response transcriptional regulator